MIKIETRDTEQLLYGMLLFAGVWLMAIAANSDTWYVWFLSFPSSACLGAFAARVVR